MAFLDRPFLLTQFPGITFTCSVTYVKAGQNERFALCLTHCHLKIENTGISQQLGLVGDGHRLQTYRFTAFNLKQLIFSNDHNAVFMVFCGNTSQ